MKSAILLDLAYALWFFPMLRPLQNKLLVASWNAQRASGKGPWVVI